MKRSRRWTLRAALSAALAAVLAGCSSAPGSQVPGELATVRLESVRGMVEQGEYARSIEAIETLGVAGETDATELEELRAEAVARLSSGFGEAMASGSPSRALDLAISLRAAGEPVVASGREWTDAELLLEAARVAAEKGPGILAVHWGFRLAALVGASAVSSDARERFAALLRDLKDPAALEKLDSLLAASGVPREPAAERTASRALPMADPISGTVTVLVDRGLKVENRVGTPDRMLGSGFFVVPSGYIMTNHHVISSEVDPEYEGFSRLYVMRPDRPNERIPARVVGFDRVLDLAVLKAEIEAQYAYYPGFESELRPGDQVIAIGSPLALESTVSSGIVSAVGRRFLQIGDVMQIDVPVNPGNSGGPLLDSDRRLAGVVFAGLEQYEGLNFAIPSRWIGKVLPRLFAGGEVRHAWLGASVLETEDGLEVVYTVPGGTASRVGIREGDLLERVGGEEARDLAAAQGTLMELEPSTLVRLEWRRGEERLSSLACLDERPLSPIETALDKDTRDRILFPLFGMKLEKIGQAFGKGRYVVRKVLPGSQAAEIGLTPDDPLSIESWRVDKEQKLAVLNMYIARKSTGYLEGIVQLAAYLEQDSFL